MYTSEIGGGHIGQHRLLLDHHNKFNNELDNFGNYQQPWMTVRLQQRPPATTRLFRYFIPFASITGFQYIPVNLYFALPTLSTNCGLFLVVGSRPTFTTVPTFRLLCRTCACLLPAERTSVLCPPAFTLLLSSTRLHLLSFRSSTVRLNTTLIIFPNFFTPSSAWQSQDIAPTSSGISIPAHDANMNGGNGGDEQNWNSGGGRSPRDRGPEPPRRSSRSRSPGRGREGEAGSVSFFSCARSIWAVHAAVGHN